MPMLENFPILRAIAKAVFKATGDVLEAANNLVTDLETLVLQEKKEK